MTNQATSVIHLLPESVIIETERLLLKEITPAIWNYMYTHLTDEELISAWGLPSEQRLLEEKEKVKKGGENYRASFKYFLMVEKETGITIGSIGYHTWAVAHNRAEIGYGLESENYKRQGYMTEAMKAVLKFGFGEMRLNRVEALLSPENIASKKLVERFGFRYEGLLKEHYYRKGVYEDSAVYALLRQEYDAPK